MDVEAWNGAVPPEPVPTTDLLPVGPYTRLAVTAHVLSFLNNEKTTLPPLWSIVAVSFGNHAWAVEIVESSFTTMLDSLLPPHPSLTDDVFGGSPPYDAVQ